MPAEPTVRVAPASALRRDFAAWAVAHRVRSGSLNTFMVPERLMRELPHELVVGARFNGVIYMPDEARIAHDAPPVEDDWTPLGGELVGSPEVVAGFPTLDADLESP